MITGIHNTPEKIKIWREDPVVFVREVFGVEPDEWQIEVLRAFADPTKPRISMQACAGPGKSAVLAWCAWNFLLCYCDRGQHPKGAAVSITSDNLKDNLWAEISKWQGRSEMLLRLFQWTKERVFAKDFPSTWFLSARSFSKTADEEEQGRTLSGLHSEFVLVLIDESGDIPVAVAKAAEQALSTKPKFGKILQAGNPTSLTGLLYHAAKKARALWYIITITGDPEDPRRSKRIDIDWAREQIKEHGRDNPWVMSLILGLFPPSSINALLGPDDVAKAMKRIHDKAHYEYAQKRLGVDVARFGDDSSIIYPRQGIQVFKCIEMKEQNSIKVAARVALAKNNWRSEMEFVDGTGGYGAGVVDQLESWGHTPMEVQFAGQAIEMDKFANKRAEMWWNMAAAIKKNLSLPNDAVLAKELVAPTYTFVKGKILIEPKEAIKKRLGFSPDRADGLALTFALPEMEGNSVYAELGLDHPTQKVNLDYDPFKDA